MKPAQPAPTATVEERETSGGGFAGTGATLSGQGRAGDVVLRGVTKRYGEVVAVNNLTLEVRSGEFLADARTERERQDDDDADRRRFRAAR